MAIIASGFGTSAANGTYTGTGVFRSGYEVYSNGTYSVFRFDNVDTLWYVDVDAAVGGGQHKYYGGSGNSGLQGSYTPDAGTAPGGTISASTAWTQLLTESATVTDALIRGLVRVCTQSLTVTDLLSAGKVIVKTLTEAATVADSIVRGITRVLNETTSITATLTKAVGRLLAEGLTITDFIPRAIARALTETVSFVDSVRKYINGLLAMYSNKYSQQGTPYTDKNVSQGTSYTDKYNHPQ